MSGHVVEFRPPAERQREPASWRHTEEASHRMAWARQKVEQWYAEGLYPAVVWEPSIAIVNDLIPPQPLTVPAWARMEILWVLVHTKRAFRPAAPGVSMEFVNWPRGVA